MNTANKELKLRVDKVATVQSRQRTGMGTKIVTFSVLALMGILIMVPFVLMIVAAFTPSRYIFAHGLNLDIDFSRLTFSNFFSLFTNRDGIYWRWYGNSLFITAVSSVLVLLFTSMVGYGLSLYQFKGRNFIFTLVLILMMVPPQILLIPLFRLMTTLRLMDTFAGVILPGLLPAGTIFFFRQFCMGLPKDYAEAARIDGCGEGRIFFQIYVPLMKPAFGAMTILTGMGVWNDFLWPLVVLRSTENLTLAPGLLSAMTPHGNNYDLLFAGSLMAVIPIVILFLFNQKSFIEGLTVGGVKG